MSSTKESTAGTSDMDNKNTTEFARRRKFEYRMAKRKPYSKPRQLVFDEVIGTVDDIIEVSEQQTRFAKTYGDRNLDKLTGSLRVLVTRMRKRLNELMATWDFADKDLSGELLHLKEQVKKDEHKNEILKKELENMRVEVKKWKTDYITLQKQSESFMLNKGRLENEIVIQKNENAKLREKLGRQDVTIRSILLARRNQRMAYKPENDDGNEKLITNEPKRITTNTIKDIRLPTDYEETHYTNHEMYDQGRSDIGDTKKWLESLRPFDEDHRHMVQNNKFDDVFTMSPLKWIKIGCCFYGKVVELYQRGTLIKLRSQEEDGVLYSRFMEIPPSKGYSKGYVLIINNTHFYGGVNKVYNSANNRPGASEESVQLMKFFNERGYHIFFYWNITAEEIVRAMFMFKNLDHTVSACAVCCIASRGEKNKVFGCDSKNVNVKDMIKLFNVSHSRNSQGKPKLFFVEVGKPMQRSSDQADNIALEKARARAELGKEHFQIFIPEMSEVLVAYYSETGEFLSPEPGVTPESIYFTHLVRNITEHHKKEDITRILIRVHEALRRIEMEIDGKRATPLATFECNLTKPVYL